MKEFFSTVVLSFALSCLAVAQSTEVYASSNCVRISIGLKDGAKSVKVDEPFTLRIRIENLFTNKSLAVEKPTAPAGNLGFAFSVKLPSGSMTTNAPKTGQLYSSGLTTLIGPGKTKEFELDPRRVCEFKDVGSYSILVEREVVLLPDDKMVIVSSEPFTFSIRRD